MEKDIDKAKRGSEMHRYVFILVLILILSSTAFALQMPTTSQLPAVDGDIDTWGDKLNIVLTEIINILATSFNSDGTFNATALTNSIILSPSNITGDFSIWNSSISIPCQNITGAVSNLCTIVPGNGTGNGTGAPATTSLPWANITGYPGVTIPIANITGITGTTLPAGNITAGTFLGTSYTFTDLIVNRNLTVFGSITNANVSNININGSFYPTLNATFDIGSPSLLWNNGYFGTSLQVNGNNVITTATLPATVTSLPWANITGYPGVILPWANITGYPGVTIPIANVTGITGTTLPWTNITGYPGVTLPIANITGITGITLPWGNITGYPGVTVPAANLTSGTVQGVNWTFRNITASNITATNLYGSLAWTFLTGYPGVTLPIANITGITGITLPWGNITGYPGVTVPAANLTSGTVQGVNWTFRNITASNITTSNLYGSLAWAFITGYPGVTVPWANLTGYPGVTVPESNVTNLVNDLAVKVYNLSSDSIYANFSQGTATPTLSINVSALDDRYAHGLLTYYLYNGTSDISGYHNMSTTTPDQTATEKALLNSSVADGDQLQSWATMNGSSVPIFIQSGAGLVHIHALKGGGKTAQIYAKVYQRNSTGTENLLVTSELSPPLTTSEVEYDLHLLFSSSSLNTTDRIVVKIFANITGIGATPTVTLFDEGATEARLDLPTSASVITISSGTTTLPWTNITGYPGVTVPWGNITGYPGVTIPTANVTGLLDYLAFLNALKANTSSIPTGFGVTVPWSNITGYPGVTVPIANVTGITGTTLPIANITGITGVTGLTWANITSYIGITIPIGNVTGITGTALPIGNVTNLQYVLNNLTGNISAVNNSLSNYQPKLNGITIPIANVTGITGTTLPWTNITGYPGVTVPASNVTAGTFVAGNFNFQGAVGINTTTPSATLQVQGGAIFANGTKFYQASGDNSTSSAIVMPLGATLSFLSSTNVRTLIGTDSNGLINIGQAPTTVITGMNFGAGSAGNFTFDVNNAELMRLTSAGNLGIGTTTPSLDLVVGTDAGALTGNPAILVGGDDAGIFFGKINNTGAIRYVTSGGAGTDYMQFTTKDNGTSYVNNLVLNKGNVGIGTTTPYALLEVNGGCLRINNTDVIDLCGGTAGTFDRLDFKSVRTNMGSAFQLMPSGTSNMSKISLTNNGSIGVSNFSSAYIGVEGSNMRIAPQEVGTGYATNVSNLIFGGGGLLGGDNWGNITFNSNVGIGAANASYPLEIRSDTTGGISMLGLNSQSTSATTVMPKINFVTNNGTASLISASILGGKTANDNKGQLRFYVSDNTGTVRQYMTIMDNGYVGINTTTPSTMLDVRGNAWLQSNSTNTLNIVSDNAGNSQLNMRNAANDRAFSIGYNNTGDYALLSASGNLNKIIIGTNDNVGIGTTTPKYTLDVNGTISGTLQWANMTGFPGITIPTANVTGLLDYLAFLNALKANTSSIPTGFGVTLPIGNITSLTSSVNCTSSNKLSNVTITSSGLTGVCTADVSGSSQATTTLPAANITSGTFGTGVYAFSSTALGNISLLTFTRPSMNIGDETRLTFNSTGSNASMIMAVKQFAVNDTGLIVYTTNATTPITYGNALTDLIIVTSNNQDLTMNNATWYAQSFTYWQNASIAGVEIWINGVASSPTTGITATLRADSAGSPSSTILASGSIAQASVQTTKYNSIAFSTPYNITSGSTYWIVFYNGDTGGNTNNIGSKAGADYANGSVSYSTNQGGLWSGAPGWQYEMRMNITFSIPLIFGNASNATQTGLVVRGSGRVGIAGSMADSPNYALNVNGMINGTGFVSNGTDYAEIVPKVSSSEQIMNGDIIGIVNGKATRDTTNAFDYGVASGSTAGFIGGDISSIMITNNQGKRVISDNFTNMPNIAMAFVGQIHTKISGSCTAGQYVIPSGNDDGTGNCVDLAIGNVISVLRTSIGKAWETNTTSGIHYINVKIGGR